MNKFKGWKTVFRFTLQKTGGKGFKILTTLLALVIIGALVLVNILVAKPEEEEKASRISKVYVVNESDLKVTDYETYMDQAAPKKFGETDFVYFNDKSREEAVKIVDQETTTGVIVAITKIETGYQLEGILSSKSEISKGECTDLLESMKQGFESSKLLQAGLSEEQLVKIMTPVVTSYQSVGEDTSVTAMVIKMVVPAFFGLIMYMMLLLHGMGVSKSVSSEKTSKLMETLLTSIHPYALITGKVLAISSLAILQFLTWIASAVVGLYGGNAVAHSIYPEYENTVVTIINFLRENIGESALTVESVIFAVAIFCIGFLFYFVLAGLAGAMVSKPEDVASTQSIFVFPIIISWLVCYLAAMGENTAVLAVTRYIPFTIPFGVPVDLLTGTISIVEGIISLIILFAFSMVFIMISARIYKGLVLYNGQKLTFKKLGQIIRTKN